MSTTVAEQVAMFYDDNGFFAKALVWIVFVVGVIKLLIDLRRFQVFCCKHSCRGKNKTLYKKYGSQKTEDSWAVVTGGSDGIGYEFCMEFARQGFNICIVARNEEKCNEKLKAIKEKTGKVFKSKVIKADFSKLYTLDDYQYIADELQGLDVGMLVINAGWAESFYSHMMPEEWVERQVTVNVYQLPFMIRKILPQMKLREKKEGAIIVVSSMAAHVNMKSGKDYCASKAYDLHYGNCLYWELKSSGIDVISYCPSKINTPLLEESNPGSRDDMIEPDVAVASCLRDLGIEHWTHGAFGHDFHGWMLGFVSQNTINKKIDKVAGTHFKTHPKFEFIRKQYPEEFKN